LGQHLNALEFHKEARTCYQRAGELDPQSPKWPHLLALLQFQDEPGAAISNLTRAVTLNAGTNDASPLRLAQALAERGRYSEATNHLHALLGTNPSHPAARLELARVHLANNQTNLITDLLSTCLTNPFTARPALLLLSQARAREGETAAANALAERALRMPRAFDWPDPYLREVQALRPQRLQLADRAGALLAQGRLADAEKVIAKLLEDFPNDAEAFLLSGRLLLQQERFAEAEERFRQHLQLNENSLNGHFQLGLLLLRQQRWEQAAPVLERALLLKPDFAQAHANLALARSRMGDPARAVESYRQALRYRPGDARTHLALAEELARLGQQKEALEQSRIAFGIDPTLERARTLRDPLTPTR
jgi:tetratricopeptide (TPR) repeat protein